MLGSAIDNLESRYIKWGYSPCKGKFKGWSSFIHVTQSQIWRNTLYRLVA